MLYVLQESFPLVAGLSDIRDAVPIKIQKSTTYSTVQSYLHAVKQAIDHKG